MKNRLTVIKELQRQAGEDGQTLALALARLQRQLAEAEGKLQTLRDYVEQYREQLRNAESSGTEWGRANAMRAFIVRLEEALAAQENELKNLQCSGNGLQAQWLHARQREKALGLLVSRHEMEARLQATRRLQKEIEEWTLRALVSSQGLA